MLGASGAMTPVLGVQSVRTEAEYDRDVKVHFQISRGTTILRAPERAPRGILELVAMDLNGCCVAFLEARAEP